MDKIIKVFIASSKELKEERLELLFVEKIMNENLENLGVKIKIVGWEFMDSAMGKDRKQDQYNQDLRSCDICCVICWQKFGKYTAEEFKVAREKSVDGEPQHKIYIFFKEPGDYSKDLLEFKNSIEGQHEHFPSYFSNLEKFKLDVYEILFREVLKWIKGADASESESQMENQTGVQAASRVESYTVRNSKIEINGIPLCDFLKLPFAQNNVHYRSLRHEVHLLEELVHDCTETLASQPCNEILKDKYQQLFRRLDKQQNLLHSMECRLLKLYCSHVQFLTEHHSARVASSFVQFNQGDDSKVHILLDTVQLRQDLDHHVKNLDEIRKGLVDLIKNNCLKINDIKKNKGQNWTSDCIALYCETTRAARKNIPEADFVELITDFAVFLQDNLFGHGNDEDVFGGILADEESVHPELENHVRQLQEARKELLDNIEEYKLKIKILQATKEKNWAADCVAFYREAVKAARNNIPEADFAELITEFAVFLQVNGQGNQPVKDAWFSESEQLFKEALPLWKSLGAKEPDRYRVKEAYILNKFAILQKKQENLDAAVQLYTESMDLYSELAGSTPSLRASVAQVRGNRAIVYKLQNKIEEAEKEYFEVIKIFRQLAVDFGSKFDAHLARNLVHLGILYKSKARTETGSLEKALEALDEAYKIRSELAKNDPDTHQHYMAIVLRIKAETLNAAKKYKEAQEVAGQAVGIFRDVLQRQPFQNKSQRTCCLLLSEQALFAVRAGLYREAEQYAHESMKLEAECRMFSKERPAPRKNLGYALLFQGGRLEEAKKWILKAASNSKSWSDTIIKELEKFKNENLVLQSFFNDIDAIVAELKATESDGAK